MGGGCGGSGDYAKKTCVDTHNDLMVAKAGDTMTGALAKSNNKVTAAQDAATKDYIDKEVRGGGSKQLLLADRVTPFKPRTGLKPRQYPPFLRLPKIARSGSLDGWRGTLKQSCP